MNCTQFDHLGYDGMGFTFCPRCGERMDLLRRETESLPTINNMNSTIKHTPHTPGPWITDTGQVPKLGRSLGVLKKSHKPGEKGESICIVALAKDAQPHDHANARLIAAAPDMVAALLKMHEAGKAGGVNEGDWYMCLLSETITKALGSDWHNANVDLPDTAARDSASKSNSPAVSG